MRTDIPLMDKVEVTTPCSASWEQMLGNEQIRFCKGCKLHVHNLSAMTRQDGESLLQTHDGRLCIRYTLDAGGNIITADNPPQLRSVHTVMLKNWGMVRSIGVTMAKQCTAAFGLMFLNLSPQIANATPRADMTHPDHSASTKPTHAHMGKDATSAQTHSTSKMTVDKRAGLGSAKIGSSKKRKSVAQDNKKSISGHASLSDPKAKTSSRTLLGRIPTPNRQVVQSGNNVKSTETLYVRMGAMVDLARIKAAVTPHELSVQDTELVESIALKLEQTKTVSRPRALETSKSTGVIVGK